jgi:MFS superfamily sulfate permease-like transporter
LLERRIGEEVVGGLVSAAVAIPLAMGFGMFAFVSLGDAYFAAGALAGLLTAFVVAIVAVLLGERSATVYAPRINSTFFLGALLYGLVQAGPGVSPVTLLLVLFSTILLGGVFQALFGAARVGTLIKFAPHPVMAGFQNTAAALLFLVQLGNVAGFDESRPFTAVLAHLDEARPLSLLVAALAFAATWQARRISPKLPPLVLGLAVGIAAYYGLLALGLGDSLGPTIGAPLESISGATLFVAAVAPGQLGTLLSYWPTILGGGLALAIVASLDSLLCARLVCRPGDTRIDADRLLGRLGAGNIVAAGLGGITGGINIGATLTNRDFGGRSRLSVLVNATAILLAVTLLFPVVALLPRAVLSAVIMVVAIRHFDPWSLRLAGRIAAARGGDRWPLILDLAVVVLVAALAIAVDIVFAVFLGVVIAGALFVVRMSRSVVRRAYRCDVVRSRKTRDEREMSLLEQKGASILVMELQGALFFGSGERLADAIDAASRDETRAVILDLRRVTEVDSTGARIIRDIDAELAGKGCRLLLALSDRGPLAARIAGLGMADLAGRHAIFADLDRAIERAEDDLIRAEHPVGPAAAELPLDNADILKDLHPDEIAVLAVQLTRVVHPAGTVIFREGDAGEEMLIVVKGTASAYIHPPGGGDVRLVTFAPGTAFGELAILDAGPRSATMIADEELVAWSLSRSGFAALSDAAPAIAIKLLRNLSNELAARLRRANRIILELES